MVRVAAETDIFQAIAEPRRRAILEFLAEDERPVNDVVAAIGLEQPAVSKHLRVLRDVGLVRVRREGRQRLYQVDGAALERVHVWVGQFERYWASSLERIKKNAERAARGRSKKKKR